MWSSLPIGVTRRPDFPPVSQAQHAWAWPATEIPTERGKVSTIFPYGRTARLPTWTSSSNDAFDVKRTLRFGFLGTEYSSRMQRSPKPTAAGPDEEKTETTADVAMDAVRTLEDKAKAALTIVWHELPTWQRDNAYITSGYRTQSNSYWKSAASLGYLHNESVNIYTHLVGAIAAAVAAVVLYRGIKPRFEMADSEDVMVFSCYFFGAVSCLGMSSTYHTICNHSEHVSKYGNKLDYIGIILLIWGSFVPSIYYGFSADPGLVRLYWSMITTIGAGTLVVVLSPKFRSPEWRPFRALMFVAMGLSAVVPMIHGVKLYGFARMDREMGLSWLVAQGALYIIGAAIYAARIPERWRPGTFDIWGSSHQIFHVLVVLAAGTHLVGLLKAFDNEHTFRSGVAGAWRV